jgi:urease accessory protein
VLEELAEKYGLTIDHTPTIFEPENGAYNKGNSKGSHGHSHAH